MDYLSDAEKERIYELLCEEDDIWKRFLLEALEVFLEWLAEIVVDYLWPKVKAAAKDLWEWLKRKYYGY